MHVVTASGSEERATRTVATSIAIAIDAPHTVTTQASPRDMDGQADAERDQVDGMQDLMQTWRGAAAQTTVSADGKLLPADGVPRTTPSMVSIARRVKGVDAARAAFTGSSSVVAARFRCGQLQGRHDSMQ